MNVEPDVVYAAIASAMYMIEYSACMQKPLYCPDMPMKVAAVVHKKAKQFMAVNGMAWWTGEICGDRWTIVVPSNKEIDAYLPRKD